MGDLRTVPGLARVGAMLRLSGHELLTIHNTESIVAAYEWEPPPTMQILRAYDTFHGRPWSFIRYTAANGEVTR